MKDSREYFDSVAPDWDRIREGYFSNAIRDKAIELAGISSQTVAADIGTGTGFMIEGIAPLVKRVIGIDSSPRMLSIAESKLPKKLRPKVEFRLGAMENLPLSDQEVNAVFANMALHHATDPLRAIKEMRRICTPGGVVVITELEEDPYKWFRQEMADRWLGFQREQVREWLLCAGCDCRCRSASGKVISVAIFYARGRK